MSWKRTFLIVISSLLFFLAGCRAGATPAVVNGTRVSPASASSTVAGGGVGSVTNTPAPVVPTPVPTPTATPEPLAMRVNGDTVSLAEYQAELRQLQEAHKQLGKTVAPEQERQQVLDNLTDMLLLAQGAVETGFALDDPALQAEIDRLAQQLGGAQGLQTWLDARGYNEASFRAALWRSLAAAWQRDQLAGKVPNTAEQIHARQIVTMDEDIAKRALERVKVPGTNFAAYAYQYETQTGGDLGWFPRGYLVQPEVEEAAFQLQPGQYSGVVKSTIGYHIVQVIAREPDRALSPDARRVLQHKAILQWLKDRRNQSQVEILLP